VSAPRPAWLALSAAALPTREETWLLRSALDAGEAGRSAWQRYRAWAGDVRTAIGGEHRTRVLAPLVHRARGRDGGIDPRGLTYLRTASFREDLRSRTRGAVVRAVLAGLGSARVGALALKETVLAETVYEAPGLRHSGACDLLLPASDLPRAARVLQGLGFAVAERSAGVVRLVHHSGLPVEARVRLFGSGGREVPPDELRARAVALTLGGVPVRALSPADALVQACVDGLAGGRDASLQWVCDAWLLVARGLDWACLVDGTRRAGLARPLAVALAYLAADLEGPIPPGVLDALCTDDADPRAGPLPPGGPGCDPVAD
jgi:hypothetical protein